MVELLGTFSARAACAQRLCGCIRYEEEGPVEGHALAVGRTAAPVVSYAEGEGVGRGAQIGHVWAERESINGGLYTLESAIYVALVR